MYSRELIIYVMGYSFFFVMISLKLGFQFLQVYCREATVGREALPGVGGVQEEQGR